MTSSGAYGIFVNSHCLPPRLLPNLALVPGGQSLTCDQYIYHFQRETGGVACLVDIHYGGHIVDIARMTALYQGATLPEEILSLICQELGRDGDFGSLYKCARSSKAFADPALRTMYQ